MSVRTRWISLFVLLALPSSVMAADGDGDSSSIWGRFQGMLADVGNELLSLVGQVMGWSVGFALLGLITGVSGGFFLWRAIRDNKWLDGRWAWCKKVYWIWAIILVGTLGLGGCSTGMIWGAGTGAKRWVGQGEFFKKTVGYSYTALMVFRADARIDAKRPDALLEKDIALLVGATRGVQDKAAQFEGQFREQLGQWLDRQKITGVKRYIMKWAAKFLWDQHINNPLGVNDAKVLVKDVLKGDQNDANRETASKIIENMADTFRLGTNEKINAMVWPVLTLTILLTFGIAFGPLCVFWIVVWASGSRD